MPERIAWTTWRPGHEPVNHPFTDGQIRELKAHLRLNGEDRGAFTRKEHRDLMLELLAHVGFRHELEGGA